MVEDYPFSMGKNFEKIIEKQLKKPEIAILELISNSWDANVRNVYITWPIIETLRESEEFFTILDDEMPQAVNYAKEIKKHGHCNSNTKIIGYVLGHTISPDEQEPRVQGNITIYAKQYQLIVKTAKNRTFDLIDKIKEVKGITDLGDGEINEVLKEDEIQTTLSD